MLNAIIDFSLRYRWVVLAGSLCAAIFGAVSLRFLDIDAFPDTTPVQVQINTVAPALGPALAPPAVPLARAVRAVRAVESVEAG